MSNDYFPLSNPQKSIWYIEKYFKGNSFSNIVGTVKFKQPVDFNLLKVALNQFLKDNDAMRIHIIENESGPWQYFAEPKEREFEIIDFSSAGSPDLSAWETEITQTPFELIDHDLYYFAFLNLKNEEQALYLKCHHIIADAWGMTLVVSRILTNYGNLASNREIVQEPFPSFQECLLNEEIYLASDKFAKHQSFWLEEFRSPPEPTLYKHDFNSQSIQADRKTMILAKNLSGQINAFCGDHKISGFIFFYALLSIYLAKLTGKNEITVLTPVLNRANAREKQTVGMFINSLPFQTTIPDSANFVTFLGDLNKKWRQLLKNQRYPYNLLQREMKANHKISGRLTDFNLSFQNARFEVENIEFHSQWHFNGNETNPLTIHISDREGEGFLIVDYDFSTEYWAPEEIVQLHHSLTTLAQNVLENPAQEIRNLQYISPQELALLATFNETKLSYPARKTLNALFAEQAGKNPRKTAVVFQNREITYQELNSKANLLARHLQEKGIKRGDIIGLMCKRSLEMLIGMLGILKAGGAYLPIDPGYPESRIAYILKDSKAQLLLTQSNLLNLIDYPIECVNLENPELYTGDDANLEETAGPDDLAYVIYTSGSTGNPKGVMLEHRAVNNFIHAAYAKLELDQSMTILSLTTFSFDIFVLESLLPLITGLKIILANDDEQKIPRLIFSLIHRHDVDVMQTTPTLMSTILRQHDGLHSFKKLRKILIGGESFSYPLLERLRLITPAQIYNMYGPTETTVWSTCQDVTNVERITIGHPLGNTQVYILDERRTLLPIGATGEIHIGGDGLARGYLDKEELTNKSFIPNPFAAGTKLYKTGDLGRRLPDGTIEYLGRNDSQVKIRGHRIELSEIESCLLKMPEIKEAAVIVKKDATGKENICAYYTGENISSESIREHLAKYLPNYMLPTYYTALEAMPLTPNGKINRKALPELDYSVSKRTQYSPPRNQIETILAELWAKSLDLEEVGIDDNFFDLGGDSLNVIEILSGIFLYKWRLSAQDFYDYPTIRELSAKIRGLLRNDFIKYEESTFNLRQIPRMINESQKRKGNNLLITGATGFLGIHVIQELLGNFEGRIYCLIRGINPVRKLSETAEFYFSGNLEELIGDKLIVINGDISEAYFGLDEASYNSLSETISAVIHTAANVKHYGTYSDFEKTNVRGTQNVIDFCLANNIPLHYASTMSVSGNHLTQSNALTTNFTENDLYIGQNYKENVYVRSKFEAEVIINKAKENGLAANIYRMGILTGRYSDGKFQKNISDNAFYNRLKSLIALGVTPSYFLEQQIEFTPVDFCAKALVLLMKNGPVDKIFHVYNNKTVSFKALFSELINLGYMINVVDILTFEHQLINMMKYGDKEFLKGLAGYFNSNSDLDFYSMITMDNSITLNYLQKAGFAWPEIDKDYLNKIIRYMEKTAFIERDMAYGIGGQYSS